MAVCIHNLRIFLIVDILDFLPFQAIRSASCRGKACKLCGIPSVVLTKVIHSHLPGLFYFILCYIVWSSVCTISVLYKPGPFADAGIQFCFVKIRLESFNQIIVRNVFSIFHIPVGSLNTPHQKILSFFACKVVDHLHGCFRIFTILGDRDCIPARCTSSGVSSFICTDSVSKDFIGIEFCIFSYRRSKCCICCIGIPVGSKGTEYVACRQFLRPLIFLVDNPLFVQKAFGIQFIGKGHHLFEVWCFGNMFQIVPILIICFQTIHSF